MLSSLWSRCKNASIAALLLGVFATPALATFERGLVAYERGDFDAALKIWRRAAKSGHPGAQHNLAVMYDHGRGVPVDDAKAVHWYTRAANSGHAPSQYTLGLLHSRGQGVEKSMREAVKWYTKAADQGHVESQFVLGVLYDFGKGVRKSERKAVSWYKRAATQGDARAQYNLALMYDFGQGGIKDITKAIKWYRRAAEQGNAKAQYMLGIAYLKGEGVAQSNPQAYAWITLAAASGHVRARQYRVRPWKRMNAAERKQGKKLARELRAEVRLRRSLSLERTDRAALPTFELVRDTQRVLAQKGLLKGAVDGILGPKTRAGIRALQEKMRLPQTGEPTMELLLLADPD
ncbi:MAG: SEL1-like repeat protein [Pseudomonadota bacterium]